MLDVETISSVTICNWSNSFISCQDHSSGSDQPLIYWDFLILHWESWEVPWHIMGPASGYPPDPFTVTPPLIPVQYSRKHHFIRISLRWRTISPVVRCVMEKCCHAERTVSLIVFCLTASHCIMIVSILISGQEVWRTASANLII